MYEYISGKVSELTPTYVVIENHGIGYIIHLSLNSYSSLQGKAETKLFLHQVIREDAHTLFGFSEAGEREMFRLLISVNGIGSNTGIMMLSAMTYQEIQQAILSENVAALKGVKGIGAKTAQRVILDLKDKLSKTDLEEPSSIQTSSAVVEEASMALVMLGFAKKAVDKSLGKISKEQPNASVEELVKLALKDL